MVVLLGAIAALGSALAASTVTASPAPGTFGLGDLLPFDSNGGVPLSDVAHALGLLLLAIGLARAKRLAWGLGIVVFAAALIVRLGPEADPAAALVAGGSLAILVGDRSRYVASTSPRLRPWLVAAVVLGAVGVVDVAWTATAASGVALGRTLADLAGWLAFSDQAVLRSTAGTAAAGAAPILLSDVALALAGWGALRAAPVGGEDPLERERARSIIARYGHGALVPFQQAPDKRLFSLAGSAGVVAYGRAGRAAVILGDPVGPPADADRALLAFLEDARFRDEMAATYQASDGGLPALHDAGFRSFAIGREAIVDLASFDLTGSRRANLRHTITRAGRGGVTVRWYPEGLAPEGQAGLVDELVAIDEAWQAHAGPAMGFTIGQFEREDVLHGAVSVATGEDGHAIAFATFCPTGVDGGWVLDLMRRVGGGTPGALEWCIAEAGRGLRVGGASRLSLGLAPLAGLEGPDGTIEERALAAAARLVRRWYDIRGLEFFKAKFDPTWEPRYLAIRSRADLPGVTIALLRLHLGGFRGALAGSVRSEARGLAGRRPGGGRSPDPRLA